MALVHFDRRIRRTDITNDFHIFQFLQKKVSRQGTTSPRPPTPCAEIIQHSQYRSWDTLARSIGESWKKTGFSA
jgi:hypothetical protein